MKKTGIPSEKVPENIAGDAEQEFEKMAQLKSEKKTIPHEEFREKILMEEQFKKAVKSRMEPEKREEILTIDIRDDEYPELLRQISDPPQTLYAIGDISLMKRRCVAVVGARKASSYGKWVSYHIGKRLAEYDIVTVSGMAYGCDSEAHRGALDAGGPTIAVMGCGPDICYPASNAALRQRIAESGLILSEYPVGMKPRNYTFPQRNRIISGLCEAVTVAEAGLSSGSLITAACAGDQGRMIFSVPGNISSTNSIGCNKLIQDGAYPVAFIDDILAGIGIKLSPERLDSEAELGEDERKIYEILKTEGEVTTNFIAKRLGKTAAEVNGMVGVMEIKGFLVTSMGKIFIAN